jgi:hypothetical protein
MHIDADTVTLPDGRIREVWRDSCAHGHPTVQCGTAPCGRCGRYTRLYFCDDLRCDGEVTSYKHEAKCPPG